MQRSNWSISSWGCFNTCPRQYKGKYLEGIRDKPGPAAQRGNMIHAKAENYLNGNIRGLPPELEKLRSNYTKLKKAKPLVEIPFAVNQAWKPVSWKKGWARGILDALVSIDVTMIYVDHKTGRIYDHHENQAEVYACLVHSNVPHMDEYHGEFWYTDQGEIITYTYAQGDIPDLKKKWTERANQVLTATRFPEKPTEFGCKYCPVSSKKGGPCHGWKKV